MAAPSDSSTATKRRANGLLRWLGGGAVLLGLVLALLWVFRASVATLVAQQVVADRGVAIEKFKIVDIGPGQLVVEDLKWRDEDQIDVSISRITIDYSPGELVEKRRVRSIKIDGGAVIVSQLPLGGGQQDTEPFPMVAAPFDVLDVSNFRVQAQIGPNVLKGDLSARFDVAKGGAAALVLEGAGFKFGELNAALTDGAFNINLSPDGAIDLTGAVAGGANFRDISIEKTRIDLNAEGSSWRDVLAGELDAFVMQADMNLAPTSIETNGVTFMNALGAPIQTEMLATIGPSATAQGALSLVYADGEVTLTSGDQTEAFELMGVRGGGLRFSALDGAPFYHRGQNLESISVRLEGAGEIAAVVDVTAENPGTKRWNFETSGDFGKANLFGVSLRQANLSVSGWAEGAELEASVNFGGAVDSANIGRLTIADTTMDASAFFAVDLESKLATLALKDCATVEESRFAAPSQNLKLAIKGASLCPRAAPLLTLEFGSPMAAKLAGSLQAEHSDFSFGETNIAGAPPVATFDFEYLPEAHASTLNADLGGGSLVVNQALNLAKLEGDMTVRLIEETLEADIKIDRVRVAQASSSPIASPTIARGAGKLRGDNFEFDYEMMAPRGAPIGKGGGKHNMVSANGSMHFGSGPLVFAADNLRLTDFSPVFRGLMSEAAGAGEANFDFAWTGSNLSSGGDITIKNLSFRGPGLAVTRTAGVSGVLKLEDLLPITSEGKQQLAIGLVDMDALKLENGQVEFDLPGDDTFRIESAVFPWFGGRAGVFDAVSRFDASRVEMRMIAEEVDLAEVFAFLDIKGLSGRGAVAGELPIIIEEGRARIENGVMRATAPGELNYLGAAGDAAAGSNGGAALAFEALRALRFDTLEAIINGPLDGELDIGLVFKGVSDVTVNDPRVRERVAVPINYTMNIKAPLMDLMRQGQASTDFTLRVQEYQRNESAATQETDEEQ